MRMYTAEEMRQLSPAERAKRVNEEIEHMKKKRGAIPEEKEKAEKVLAHILYETNSSATKNEWLHHVMETGEEPEKFFAGNAEGLAQYNIFVKQFDKDRYAKQKLTKKRGR